MNFRPSRLLLAGLALLILLSTSQAFAEAWPQQGSEWPGFLGGVASGILLHELGHVVVASSQGYETRMDGLSLVYSPPLKSDRDKVRVATAGFQAQWIASEVAFRYEPRCG